MTRHRWAAAGLVTLAVGVAANAILGPLVTDVIRYRTSATTLNQIVGGDAAALLIVTPVCLLAAVLLVRRHVAAAVIGLAPAAYAVYTLPQLVIGQRPDG